MSAAPGSSRADVPSSTFTTVDVVLLLHNDEATVLSMVGRLLALRASFPALRRIILVDSASPDASGALASLMAALHPDVASVRLVEPGYAAAVRAGFAAASADYVAVVDGDGEYPVEALPGCIEVLDGCDMVLTFRTVRLYSRWRRFVSYVYASSVRGMFRVSFRDVGSGMKVYRRASVPLPAASSGSSFVAAEVLVRILRSGGVVREVPLVPRLNAHRPSGILRPREVARVLRDMLHLRLELSLRM